MLEDMGFEYNSWVSKYANPHLVFYPFIDDLNVTYDCVNSSLDIRELTKFKIQTHKFIKIHS